MEWRRVSFETHSHAATRLLSRFEVCEIFGIHERTLLRWEQRGLIGVVRVGRTVRFRPDEIDRLLASKIRR